MLFFALKLLSLTFCAQELDTELLFFVIVSGIQLVDNLSINVRLPWTEVQICLSNGCSQVKI